MSRVQEELCSIMGSSSSRVRELKFPKVSEAIETQQREENLEGRAFTEIMPHFQTPLGLGGRQRQRVLIEYGIGHWSGGDGRC